MSKKNREARRAAARAAEPVPGVLGDHGRETRPVKTRGAGAGNRRWDALEQLRVTADQERELQERRHRHVMAARKLGASWVDIARVLGVSPQAVQQRYGRPS
jgi:hypothetical protein